MTLAASSHVKILTQVFFCKGYKSVKQHMFIFGPSENQSHLDGISLVAHPSHHWLVRESLEIYYLELTFMAIAKLFLILFKVHTKTTTLL